MGFPAQNTDETEPDYIGKLESALGEPFHQADTDIVYLLGGTPKMRQPFEIRCGLLLPNGNAHSVPARIMSRSRLL